jgi:hypothetical protein
MAATRLNCYISNNPQFLPSVTPIDSKEALFQSESLEGPGAASKSGGIENERFRIR